MSTKPITIRVDEEEMETLDRLTATYGYKNRSDAIRAVLKDAARAMILEKLREEVAASVANKEEQKALREEYEAWESASAW